MRDTQIDVQKVVWKRPELVGATILRLKLFQDEDETLTSIRKTIT